MGSYAKPHFRFPTFQEHVADLRKRPRALLALLHNLLPVLGIFLLGWSLPLVVFTYWFDGAVGIGAILAAVMPRLLSEVDETKKKGPVGKVFYGLLTWGIVMVFIGLPYWIVLIPLGRVIFADAVLVALRSSPDVWVTVGLIVGGQAVAAYRRGYGALPDKELKQALRWDVYLLVLRAIAMFVVAANIFPFLIVPVLALVFTYMEIWPGNALGAVFGDPSRLHEYDPETDGSAKPAARGRKRSRLPS